MTFNVEETSPQIWLPRRTRLYLPARPRLAIARALPKASMPETEWRQPPASQKVRLWPLSSQPRKLDDLLADYEAHPVIVTPARSRAHGEALSSREHGILALIAAGQPNKAIATQLHLSVGTVKWHIINIYRKLDVTSRTQAVARARAIGMLS